MDQSLPDTAGEQAPEVNSPRNRTPRWRMAIWLLILGCILGYMGYVRYRSEKQQEVVDTLAAQGGVVIYDYQGARATDPEGPEWVRAALGNQYFVEPVSAAFNGPQFDDQKLSEVLKILPSLPRIETVNLDDSSVTDQGLQQLGTLKQLRTVSIVKSKVTHQGVEDLKKKFGDRLKVIETRPF